MTEIKRASEMSIEQIREVLRDMDWSEIHVARVFSDTNDKVVLLTDGSFSVRERSHYFLGDDAADEIADLSCWGGDVDSTRYPEDWTEELENGFYRVDDDFRKGTDIPEYINEEQMIEIAIREGDYTYWEHSYYYYWIKEIMATVQRDRE